MSEAMTYSPSIRYQIAGLDVGESFAKCERLELELLTKEAVNERTAALRNTVSAAARRAMGENGSDYAVETGNFLTASRDLMLIAVVTRRA